MKGSCGHRGCSNTLSIFLASKFGFNLVCMWNLEALLTRGLGSTSSSVLRGMWSETRVTCGCVRVPAKDFALLRM